MMADVSVVIPTHHRDDLLPDAIRAAVEQTLRPLEVIVCDDLGAESTRAIVEEWTQRTGGLVRYVDSSGTGYKTAGASRNVGARQARGSMLAFVDDDDVWHRDHLEQLASAITSDGVDFAVSWTQSDDPTFVFARMEPGLGAKDVVSRNPGFVGSNFLIRAERFFELDGFDPALRVSNDQDLLVRLLSAGAKYSVVPRVSVLNRIHTADQLTDKTEARFRGVRAYYAKHSDLMGWRDKVMIGTIIAGIRRISAPRRLLRIWFTFLTAAGKGILLVTKERSR
jgi:glycosyltransferase involved in cell wall biosynthesis